MQPSKPQFQTPMPSPSLCKLQAHVMKNQYYRIFFNLIKHYNQLVTTHFFCQLSPHYQHSISVNITWVSTITINLPIRLTILLFNYFLLTTKRWTNIFGKKVMWCGFMKLSMIQYIIVKSLRFIISMMKVNKRRWIKNRHVLSYNLKPGSKLLCGE